MSATYPFLVHDLDQKKIEGDTLRTFSLEATHKKLFSKLQQLGITRINHISDLDIFSLPVVSVTRPNVHKYQLTAAQGKGINHTQSLVSALMEAVERHAGESYTIDLLSSCNKMTCPFISPIEFGYDCGKDLEIDWMRGFCLSTHKEIYVPASTVVFPYIPSKSSADIFSSSTNGIASGNTHYEAILHGLFEVIERHTISLFLKGAPAPYLDLESVPETEKNLIKSITDTGSQICILDLSEAFMLPTYFTSIMSSHPLFPGTLVAGQGSHVFQHMALRRSITEAVQSHAVSLQGSREDLIRHHNHWKTSEEELFQNWNEARKSAISEGVKQYKEKENPKNSIMEWVNLLIHELDRKGFNNVIAVDLTHENINIPVISLSVPGLEETLY